MRRIVVFFSWQSDTPNNHSKMKSGLEKACKKLSKEFGCEVVYDEATRGEVGAPKIEDVAQRKIDDCDVFVADVTPVTEHKGKLMPNSNVSYELGRARGVHPYQRIVTLGAKGNWETKDLPFDFNHTVVIPVDVNDSNSFYKLIKDSVIYALNSPQTIFSQDDSVLYSDSQIQKNINSGKYLPNTFLDNRELKEHLRYFVDPFLFSAYVSNKVYLFNFNRLNRGRKIWNKPSFNFNAKQFQIEDSSSDFAKLYASINKLMEYLQKKSDELNHQSNESYLSSIKCKRRLVDLSFLRSQICLLTGNAGQGKTNFVCDLVQNVLCKRHIPYIYLNGYELDPSDIEESFVKEICPMLRISFEEVMKQISSYCSSKRKPILLVIDGLNENPHPDEFCRTLVGFLKRIQSYDFCKILMTCRSEYLSENFTELTSTFKDKMLIERDIYQHFTENEEEQLLGNYLNHFEIKAFLSVGVKKELTHDLLLLRIFCEANSKKSLGYISHIKRDELFSAYYSTMLSRVAEAHDWEGRKTFREIKIKQFFEAILKNMINTDTFFNVPLDDLLIGMSQEDVDMLQRFLDENILLRKDLAKGKIGFENAEVINFTYDAFRDYLLAHYILDAQVNDVEKQKSLIVKFTAEGHQLKEGITPFLFVHAKNSSNHILQEFLKEQPWYIPVFDSCIWEVDESKLTDEDISCIQKRLSDNPKTIARRLFFWGRWNTEEYPRLNIKILLDYVAHLDDEALTEWVERACSADKLKGAWGRKQQTEREFFIEMIENLLGNSKILGHEDTQFIFEFYAYVAVVSGYPAKSVYLEYIEQSGNVEQIQHIANSTRSKNMKTWMKQIMAR